MTTNSQLASISMNQKAIQGIDKHFAGVTSLKVAGVDYSPATLKESLQAENDEDAALDRLRAQMKEQMATTLAARTEARATRKRLKAYILGTFGSEAAQTLQDFGLNAPKPSGPKSVEAKANAVLRSHATRVARNTIGKRQKLAIKGVPQALVDLSAGEANSAPPPPAPPTKQPDVTPAPPHS